MKKDKVEVSVRGAKPGSPDSGEGKETSGLDKGITATLRVATQLFKSFGAYILALTGAVIGLEKLPQMLGCSIALCAVIVSVPILLVFFTLFLGYGMLDAESN